MMVGELVDLLLKYRGRGDKVVVHCGWDVEIESVEWDDVDNVLVIYTEST